MSGVGEIVFSLCPDSDVVFEVNSKLDGVGPELFAKDLKDYEKVRTLDKQYVQVFYKSVGIMKNSKWYIKLVRKFSRILRDCK